jgi:tRNA (guanine10-N2)-methyltransferase
MLDDHCPDEAAGVFDAIVTDPPYGVRAGARRGYTSTEATAAGYGTGSNCIDPANRDQHFARSLPYAGHDLLLDLVDLAARLLRIGRCLSPSVNAINM